MSLQISEKKQDKLSVAVSANNLDGKLGDLPDPLPDTSGFNINITDKKAELDSAKIVYIKGNQIYCQI